MNYKSDRHRKAVFASIQKRGLSSSSMFSMDQKKVGMDTANKNYKLNKQKFGNHGMDNSQKGVRVSLTRKFRGHPKGMQGTVFDMTTYGGKPVDMTVYFDDGKLTGDIPIEDIGILDPIDTPKRVRSQGEWTRSIDVVDNGKRVNIETTEPKIRPEDIDGHFNHDWLANTRDTLNHNDAVSLAEKLTHSSKIKSFVSDVEKTLKEKKFGVNPKQLSTVWRTDYKTKKAMEIGGLSSNELYAPNGGADVQIYSDRIQVSGHYSEVEHSHARVFSINQTHEALAFLKKVTSDINNVHHVSYM
jgi:hypothetical protein